MSGSKSPGVTSIRLDAHASSVRDTSLKPARMFPGPSRLSGPSGPLLPAWVPAEGILPWSARAPSSALRRVCNSITLFGLGYSRAMVQAGSTQTMRGRITDHANSIQRRSTDAHAVDATGLKGVCLGHSFPLQPIAGGAASRKPKQHSYRIRQLLALPTTGSRFSLVGRKTKSRDRFRDREQNIACPHTVLRGQGLDLPRFRGEVRAWDQSI
jgi:hypothetical protein